MKCKPSSLTRDLGVFLDTDNSGKATNENTGPMSFGEGIDEGYLRGVISKAVLVFGSGPGRKYLSFPCSKHGANF